MKLFMLKNVEFLLKNVDLWKTKRTKHRKDWEVEEGEEAEDDMANCFYSTSSGTFLY